MITERRRNFLESINSFELAKKYTKHGVLYKCHYCRRWIEDHLITVDHKIPKEKGGTFNQNNLLPACEKCNRKKANMSYEEFILMLKQEEVNEYNK